jgi:hypothetical protein
MVNTSNHASAMKTEKERPREGKQPLVKQSQSADLLWLLLVAKSLLGTEGSNVSSDQDIELFLQLGTITKEEKDLPDNKVRSKDKSYVYNENKKGFLVTNKQEIGP